MVRVTISPRTALHPLSPCNLFLALLEIQRIRIHTFSLGYQEERDNGTCDVASEENPEDICDADLCAQVVEQHAR